MDYLIKVEVVGDYGLRAVGFMDDEDTVMLSIEDSAMHLSSEEVKHGAMLVDIAAEQLDILRAAEVKASQE